jgi:hypothetical protein
MSNGFLVNPDGEIDGVILIGAIEAALVHVPPHLSAEIEAGFQIGDAVRVRGVRLRGTSMIVAIALIAADGRTIIDQGSPGKQDEKLRKHACAPETGGSGWEDRAVTLFTER